MGAKLQPRVEDARAALVFAADVHTRVAAARTALEALGDED